MRTDSQVGRWVDRAFAVIAALLTAGMLAAALGQVISLRSYQVVVGKAKASVAAPPRLERSGTFVEYPLVY
jgi:hypothetical protein